MRRYRNGMAVFIHCLQIHIVDDNQLIVSLHADMGAPSLDGGSKRSSDGMANINTRETISAGSMKIGARAPAPRSAFLGGSWTPRAAANLRLVLLCRKTSITVFL